MSDREKVLYELKHQVADADWCDNEWKDNVPIWMLRDALALLKAQDTVEHALSVLKAHGWKENKSTYCPNCGAYVEVKT